MSKLELFSTALSFLTIIVIISFYHQALWISLYGTYQYCFFLKDPP